MNSTAESWVVRLLTGLARAVIRHPGWFVVPQLVLFVVCVWVTVDRLQFDMDRNNLVGTDQRYHQAFMKYLVEFDAGMDLVAVVESESREKNRQFVERLGARMQAEPELFTNVFFKGDLKLMGPKALLLVTNASVLVEMDQRLVAARPMLESFSQVTNLVSLFKLVNRQFRSAAGEMNESTAQMLQALPAMTRIVNLAADAAHRPGQPISPGVAAMFDAAEEAEAGLYITFATNRMYLVTARPLGPSGFDPAVRRMRELVRDTQVEVPGVNVGVTGEPVLEVDEMAQSQKDTTKATVMALALCSLLFIYGYRETGRPLKAVFCLVIGLGYTMGFATVAIGHLNLLTITFLPILVGLAIDFGIHLVTRYEEELRHGRSAEEAITQALVNTGQGIFTGAFTTAGAFLAMGLTDFKGIQEMGVISGCGLVICLVPMMTMLPVLLLRGRQNVLDHQPTGAVEGRARLERWWMERPRTTTAIVLGVTVVALLQFPKVYFDYNLLNLQTRGLAAVEYEHKLIEGASKSVIFGAVVAHSAAEAVELEARLRALRTVGSVDSVAGYLAEDQTEKLKLIRQIKGRIESMQFAVIDQNPVDLPELRFALQALHAYVGLGTKGARREGEERIAEELRELRVAVSRLRQAMTAVSAEVATVKLGIFQRALFEDLHDTLIAIRDQDASAPLRVEDLPETLRSRFVSRSGTNYLLQVNPLNNVWDRTNQEEFVRELRTVDPEVTGTPVQLLEYTTLLKDSYEKAAWYALGAIAFLVLIHFRSPVSVVLALIPVVVGTTWLVGWMGWWGVPFNLANIMTLPLVVGVGVTNGIHILNRFAEEQNPRILDKSTGKAVLLSALTTVAGFGSLIAAKHQGIASLGMIMAVGTATCMVSGVTFLPTVLNWLSQRGWMIGKKKPRSDNAQSLLSSGGTEA